MKNFTGAKGALFYEGKILVCLRDNKPEIPYPNMWDIPGGGREGDETPTQTFLREVYEEFSIKLDPVSIIWEKSFENTTIKDSVTYFFVANLTKEQVDNIVFGDEGQKWTFVTLEEFLANNNAISNQKNRIRDYLKIKDTN